MKAYMGGYTTVHEYQSYINRSNDLASKNAGGDLD